MVKFLDDVREAGELPADGEFHKILFYGKSGCGKTWALAQAEDPDHPGSMLILQFERIGIPSMRASNPKVRYKLIRIGTTYDDAIAAMKAVAEVLEAAKTGELQAQGITRLGFDGLTALQGLIKRQIELYSVNEDDDDEKKKKVDVFDRRDWGELKTRWNGIMTTLRDLPIDIACTALANVQTLDEEESKIETCGLMLEGGQAGQRTMAFFNVVAFMYQTGATRIRRGRGAEAAADRCFLLEGDSRFEIKAQTPLKGVLKEPIWKWFRALRDGTPIGATPTDADRAAAAAPTEEPDKSKGPVADQTSAPKNEAAATTAGATTPKSERRRRGASKGETDKETPNPNPNPENKPNPETTKTQENQ